MRVEKEIFNAGLKLVGVLNIIWGLIALMNCIPLVIKNFYNWGILALYHVIVPIFQSVIGLYLVKNGRLFHEIAYGDSETGLEKELICKGDESGD